MRYTIVKNEYKNSEIKAKEVEQIISNFKWVNDEKNPEVVFIIGGDGTFLKAIQKYNKKIDKIFLVPIKSGGIGFYTNYNCIENIENVINNIKNFKPIELKSLKFNDTNAINEIKIINSLKPLSASIYINDEILEDFKGTGLAFVTPSGSTGFSKSQNGAIILDENNIFEMLEIAPISNNIFRTINSPIILSENHTVKVVLESTKDVEIIADSVKIKTPENGVIQISLSNKTIKLISVQNERKSKIEILNSIFTLNKKFKD